jgi:hypothetical protein
LDIGKKWVYLQLKFSFFVQYGIQDGGYGMTWFNIGPYGKNVLKDIWDN